MRTVPPAWLGGAVIVALVGLTAVVGLLVGKDGEDGEGVACTEEARLCPDSSAVGRAGPECRFDPCPLEEGAGVVEGQVSIGPLAPVEQPGATRTPVPPEVYRERAVVFTSPDGRYRKVVAISDGGAYAAWLWPGRYVVDINRVGIDTAKGLPTEIEIRAGERVRLDIEIDTGIR